MPSGSVEKREPSVGRLFGRSGSMPPVEKRWSSVGRSESLPPGVEKRGPSVGRLSDRSESLPSVEKREPSVGRLFDRSESLPPVEKREPSVERLPSQYVPIKDGLASDLWRDGLPSDVWRDADREVASVKAKTEPSLSELLSQRPVGRVPSNWKAPVEKERRKQNTSAVEGAIMGKLNGTEWAPQAAPKPVAKPSRLAAARAAQPDESVAAFVGAVSRTKAKLDSLPATYPSAPTSINPMLVSPGLATAPVAAPKTDIRKLASVMGLVTRLVGVFDDQKKRNETPGESQKVQRREVSVRGNGARRAKVDAALALAASRTRQRQRANAGVEGKFDANHGLQRHEVKLLENIFKTYDGNEGSQVDMREFSAAMSNPKIAHLIRRVVHEGSQGADASAKTGAGPESNFTLAEEPTLNDLSVEALFDGETIRHAAAVTLQALTRRVQTQRKLGN